MNATFWDSLCNYAILRSRCAKELHGVISIFCKKVGNRVGKKLSKAKALTIFYRKGLIFMVRPARFELTTFGSGGQRSIQLSYERIRTFLICFVLAAVKAGRPGNRRWQTLERQSFKSKRQSHVLHICGYFWI